MARDLPTLIFHTLAVDGSTCCNMHHTLSLSLSMLQYATQPHLISQLQPEPPPGMGMVMDGREKLRGTPPARSLFKAARLTKARVQSHRLWIEGFYWRPVLADPSWRLRKCIYPPSPPFLLTLQPRFRPANWCFYPAAWPRPFSPLSPTLVSRGALRPRHILGRWRGDADEMRTELQSMISWWRVVWALDRLGADEGRDREMGRVER